MITTLEAKDYLYSEFGSDPDMSDLVNVFVSEMPGKIADIERHALAKDWRALGVISHQIKGAAGSYGFHQLTTPAGRLEQAARGNLPEEAILRSVEELLDVCSRLRSGAELG